MVIRDHVADFAIQLIREVREGSRSGEYDGASRAKGAQAAADCMLAAAVRGSHQASHGRCGSPRVHADLRAHGRWVGCKLVA